MNILEDTNFTLLENFTSSAQGQYTKYLKEHISNVQKGYEYLKKNIPDIFSDLEIPMDEMDKQIKEHDKTKWSEDEFEPYAEHFYGKNKGIDNDSDFEIAWEHHYNNNPHHPEFWSGKEMPLSCIIEMICDWWSFSWKNGDLFEIFKYYSENDKPDLDDTTRSKVEEILRKLKDNLQRYSSTTLEKLTEEIENYKKNILESSYFKTKDIIDVSKFKAIDKMISGSHKILIARHISPDADAVFSAKALYMGIKEKYPKKEVILGNEKTTEFLNETDLLIVLDLGVESRIASQYIGNPKIIRIDHHPNGSLKADINLELSDAGSTCEIITLFLSEMGYTITKEMAEGLFKGIITDTGRMQYSLNQTTLAAMSILTDLGIDYKKIYNQIYVKDEISIKSKAYILNNYKKTPNGVAYLFIDKTRAKEAGIDIQKTIEQVYELSEIRNCPIWVILRENSHGEINLSVRSRVIPINQIAKTFGGGGHDNAAGIKVKSRDEAKEVLLKLDEYVKTMKNKIPNLN